MNPIHEEVLFALAVNMPGNKRAGILDAMCDGDSALRARLEVLLAAHDEPEELFVNAAAAATAKLTLDDRAPRELADESVGQTLGRYKLLDRVGEGGCGVVYVAEQTHPVRRRVALKVIKLGMDTRDVIARFEAERQALAMMDHPNIAKVLDAGTTEIGRPYFVMELVRGIRITDYCDQANLSTRERLDLFIKVCQAIQHAHQKGIIHRDIKPSNILVTLHDGVPVPKVIDFGIAKATEGRLTEATVYTQLHQFIGTPAYMSPEQAEMSGLDIDTRSDIYSLGVLLYELLAGITPFDAKELMASGIDAMRKTIREKEPVRPSARLATLQGEELTTAAKRRSAESTKLLRQLKGDLDWIVMKCLEKDRTRRYETANGLAADLKRHLTNEPVVARPPSATYRFQKAYRRNQIAFTAAACVFVAMVIAMAGIWVAAQREGLARVHESIQRNLAEQRQMEAQAAQKAAEEEQKRADAQARKAAQNQQHSRRLLYAADMNLTQQSLKLNNLGKARRLLDRHRPQPGEEDLRGWEWRYLWQLTQSNALTTLTTRPTRGYSVSFSPDGSRLAVGWFDGRVDLWDVPGRQLLRSLTDREHPYQGQVAFSPKGTLLAATSEPNAISLYDLDSNAQSIVWRAPDSGMWVVNDLSFSQDGSKLVVFAGERDREAAVWVVAVPSAQLESRHSTGFHPGRHSGAARLSPDNRRLFLPRLEDENYGYVIQCLDLDAGKELWRTDRQSDTSLSALAISPDGRTLVSGSGFEQSTICVWDAETGRLLTRIEAHTSWICKLVYAGDGRQLISAAADQSIRVFDTANWTETKVLRGHTDEVHAVAVSETAHLIASTGKDGNLMLWEERAGRDAAYAALPKSNSAPDGYRQFAKSVSQSRVLPLDGSRVLQLPPDGPPEVLDLKSDSPPAPLSKIPSSGNVLGLVGTKLFVWNGARQIVVHEVRGYETVERAAIPIGSDARPICFAGNATPELVAWTEATNSTSIYLAGLAAPSERIELKSDVSQFETLRFSEDGKYVVAVGGPGGTQLRAWNLEAQKVIVSARGKIDDIIFAADSRVLVAGIGEADQHEIVFYDLLHANSPPRRVPGKRFSTWLAVSPDGALVASAGGSGRVRLFDPIKGELVDTIDGHLNASYGLDFSGDGRRLLSGHGGKDAVKIWDVQTRQELLNLSGSGSFLHPRWSADGAMILAGSPWQAWRAPTWAEIAAAEEKQKAQSIKP